MKWLSNKFILTICVALFALTYSSFFLQGLRLFDNDYNQWLTFAREISLPTVLWQIFNPILDEWNVAFRPVQTLTFKALFSLFDYNASGYYFFKSFMLALFCATYYLFLRRHLSSKAVAALSALFLTVASSTFVSLYWMSDFVIVSEFWALLVFAVFLHLETIDQPDRKKIVIGLILMVLLTLICDRTKANGKLIPGILFLYIVLLDWRKLKRYGLAIGLMIIMLIPWPVLLSDPAPFLVTNTGTPASYAWQPASLYKFWVLFAGDFSPFSLFYSTYPPISILAVLGFPLVYLGIAAGIFLIFRKTPAPPAVRFMIVWTVVNLAALMSYPTLPPQFQARYAISVLIPLLPLALLGIHSTAGWIWKHRQAPTLLVVFLVTIQIGFHCYHTVRMRNIGTPGYMIASDTMREYIADNFSETGFFYYQLSVMAFRPTTTGNRFFSSKQHDFKEVVSSLPSGTPVFVISTVPLNESAFRLHATFPGKSDNWYDRIFNEDDNSLPVTLYLHQWL